jgi:hypothetical protein
MSQRVEGAVLALRAFRLVLAAQGVSVLGDRMVAAALAFAVLEVGGSASAVGLVLAASTAPPVASVLVGGVVADRLSRRTVVVIADVLRVHAGLMAALLAAGVAEVWMLGVPAPAGQRPALIGGPRVRSWGPLLDDRDASRRSPTAPSASETRRRDRAADPPPRTRGRSQRGASSRLHRLETSLSKLDRVCETALCLMPSTCASSSCLWPSMTRAAVCAVAGSCDRSPRRGT